MDILFYIFLLWFTHRKISTCFFFWWDMTNINIHKDGWKTAKQCIMLSFVWFSIFQMMYILLYLCTSRFQVTYSVQSVQSFSCVWLFATPWTAACQASLSITNSRRLPKLMSIELVMPSNHVILCCPLLLPPSIFPSITVFSNESVLRIGWPKYWSFSFNISPSNKYSGLIFFRMDWCISLQSKWLSRISSNNTVWKHQFSVLSFLYSPTFISIHDSWKNHSLD